MSSVSSAGASVTTLQFDLSLSLDVAEQEVQAAINAATNLLPPGLPAPPVYAKVNPADAPVAHVRRHLEDPAADPGRGHRRRAHGAEAVAGFRASAWCRSRAASARRCGSKSTRGRSPPMGWRSTTSAPTSPIRTPTCPKAPSTVRARTRRSTTTINCRPPRTTAGWSSPTRTARGPSWRCRDRRRGAGGRRAGGLGQPHSRHHPQRPAPAGHRT